MGAALGLCAGLLALPAGAQNLVRNPHFHSDTEWWSEVFGTLMWTDLADEGGCPGSGSALVVSENVNGQQVAWIQQCREIGDQANLFVQVRHLGYGTFTLRLEYFTSINCSTGALAVANTSAAQSPFAWQTLLVSGVPPDNANGVRILLMATDADPHGLSVDEVILSPRWPLLLDGFDGSDGEGGGESPPCRWAG